MELYEIREMTKRFLEEQGYDGLYKTGECACTIDDLMPCDEIDNFLHCNPGYKYPAEEGSEYGFMIGSMAEKSKTMHAGHAQEIEETRKGGGDEGT